MTLRIRDIMDSKQFNINGSVSIVSYSWDEETGAKYEEKWRSDWGNCELPPRDLMDHEITSLHITYNGCLEIEYSADEFMGHCRLITPQRISEPMPE